MQQIRIANIEIKEGDKDGRHWRNVTVIGDDGLRASTFDTSASSLKQGDMIEAEIELKGKFANIKTFKVLNLNPSTTMQNQPPPVMQPVVKQTQQPTNYPDRNESIERQVAAKIAFEFIQGEFISHTLQNAEAIYQWIHTGKLPNVAEQAHTEQGQASEVKLVQPVNPTANPTVIDKPMLDPLVPGAFKNITALVNYAKTLGMTPASIKKTTGVDDLRTIADLDKLAKTLFS